MEAEFFFDVDFDPQALAVEAVLPALVFALHGVVALVEVFVGAAPGVVHAHRVVGGDGAVDEAVDAVFFFASARRRRSSLKASVSCQNLRISLFLFDEIDFVGYVFEGHNFLHLGFGIYDF